ncbi:hypothetical protein H0Z60_09775 [Ectothiorhodospiraceae bacterium WFHF3C12]|nr:hypothetical protein [Ectothiorhodospiraceae bacterium WFHF3C12]
MVSALFWRSLKIYVLFVALFGMAGLVLGDLVVDEVFILEYQAPLIFAYLLFFIGSPLLIAIGWLGAILLVTGHLPKAIKSHGGSGTPLRPRTLGAAVFATAAGGLLAAVYFIVHLFRVSAVFLF